MRSAKHEKISTVTAEEVATIMREILIAQVEHVSGQNYRAAVKNIEEAAYAIVAALEGKREARHDRGL